MHTQGSLLTLPGRLWRTARLEGPTALPIALISPPWINGSFKRTQIPNIGSKPRRISLTGCLCEQGTYPGANTLLMSGVLIQIVTKRISGLVILIRIEGNKKRMEGKDNGRPRTSAGSHSTRPVTNVAVAHAHGIQPPSAPTEMGASAPTAESRGGASHLISYSPSLSKVASP